MERIEVDGHLLEWDRRGPTAGLLVAEAPRGGGRAGRPTAFRLVGGNGRVRLELALPPTAKTVDVSGQPTALVHLLPGAGARADPGTAAAAVARRVAALAADVGAWTPADPAASGLVRTLGGVAFPVLGVAYEAGGAPVLEVPRWAAPALAEPTPRDAVRRAFGPDGTRAVARALAAGLARPGDAAAGRLAVFRMALASMAAAVAGPDRLVRLLVAEGGARPDGCWPDGPGLAAGRALAAHLGPAVAERVLAEAVASPDGPVLLAEVCRTLPDVADRLPRRTPTHLAALRDQCLALLPLDPLGRRPVGPEGPGAGTHAPRRSAAPRPAAPRGRALVAPVSSRPPPDGVLRPPPALVGLQGQEAGAGLRLVVPRTAGELAAWGQRLHSCVGTFAGAVAERTSTIVGVEVAGALAYCLEATPAGEVRQFLGRRNREVPRHHAVAVCRWLAAAGVLDPTRPANAEWLDR